MNKKWIAMTVFGIGILIGGFILLSGSSSGVSGSSDSDAGNVRIIDGVQIIEISARGGYRPKKSIAKAGMPSIIRFNTGGTFDCSLSVRIPSLDISKILPKTGSTDIDIGTQAPGELNGSCGMGMYRFEIEFR